MDHDLPSQSLRQHWEAVTDDLRATADELEAEGWETVPLYPGDVTTVTGKSELPPGLDVMVASDDFDALEAALEDGASFEETAVYRQAAGGVMFLVCVLRDPERRVATLFPAFYPQQGASVERLREHVEETDQVDVFVHPLDRERLVTFTIDKPGLVFPDD